MLMVKINTERRGLRINPLHHADLKTNGTQHNGTAGRNWKNYNVGEIETGIFCILIHLDVEPRF